ncbi:hypothetical protein COL26b_009256 [Colletotrichum chrysophilum]|uniref:uncharacterized protein n=1 Tax=Colletotrichum chrysophilum TaxID=1836956 RepID=UPI002301D98B|nr:uncharacterized protein COL26b_009256 [Colletotrichum chrysophilum]KAJ0372213.1 hypothetical protein COL26b_009256 [Colletotrichum chrysophilum]
MYNPSAGRATGYALDQMELDPPTNAEESDAVEVDDIDKTVFLADSTMDFDDRISSYTKSMTESNCKFEIDDVESTWYMDAPFDFIHVRYMACSLRDWPAFVGRVYE